MITEQYEFIEIFLLSNDLTPGSGRELLAVRKQLWSCTSSILDADCACLLWGVGEGEDCSVPFARCCSGGAQCLAPVKKAFRQQCWENAESLEGRRRSE